MTLKFTVTQSRVNKDVRPALNLTAAKKYYLDMYYGFKSKLPEPIVEPCEGGKFVLRTDLTPGGLKSYGGELAIANAKQQVLVYCAPRFGHAPDAIAQLAKLYKKKVVFFCPASAQASKHQASLAAYPHVELRFIKIAAMPVLNSYAKKWAEANNALFLPFGLSNLPAVTAGLVHMVNSLRNVSEVWMAVSTGTMLRAFEIALPKTPIHGIAVARNMHDGEIGMADVVSSDLAFAQLAKKLPPFPSTANYDAKAWEPFLENGKKGALFVNVGADETITRNFNKVDVAKINSQREWGDMTDFERKLRLG